MKNLKTALIKTPLGEMIALGDEERLYLLEFADIPDLKREMERCIEKKESKLVSGSSAPLRSIQRELSLYFQGDLKEFKTPVAFLGSPFQNSVWEQLIKIPFGNTRSYSEIAKKIGRPTAFRAVAGAIGANQLAILIPCHRVINSSGALGGYSGGLERKKWLLAHER